MKKTTKRALIIFIIIPVSLALAYSLYVYGPLLALKPVKTGQIADTKITAVKNSSYVSVFFVKTNSGYILFDAGLNKKNMEASIKKEGIDANDVKWIFLTHSDRDHTGGLALFPDAKIYMGEDELPLINGSLNRHSRGGNSMPQGVNAGDIMLLSDRQEFLLNGTKVECLKAPGHTPGSMLYLVDGKYLFTGDAFMIKKGNIEVHIASMDTELAKKTIGQMRGIINNCSIILSSHYGYLAR